MSVTSETSPALAAVNFGGMDTLEFGQLGLSWFCSAHSRSRDLSRSFGRTLGEAGVGSGSL